MSESPTGSASPPGAARDVHVGLLGPLQLHVHGRDVDVPGARRRALLALLALAGDRGVSGERLVAALWPDEVPDNAQQALYNHVSRLRRHLGPQAERLGRRGAGYALRLGPDDLDVTVARRLAAAVARSGVEPAQVARDARAALEMWRARALDEFRSLPDLEAEALGLDELRLRLVDDLLEARLGLAEPGLVVDATIAAGAEPLRERTTLLLVRALAADGRVADAMAAAQSFRHRLAEETGLDPTPALGELERSVASGAVPASPPVPAPAAPRRVLARPDGPLVGRQHDREEVLRLLRANACVTLTGPGGVGKTRLALDVAAEPDAAPRWPTGGAGDVVLVGLAAVDQPDRVCQAVASTLRLRTSGEVRPADVAAALAGQPLLVVLDNCEHVADACRELVLTLRRDAPGVRVLATSRVSLHVPGEYVVRLQPLPVPREQTGLEALRRQPGVRAFLEHARRVRPRYELAADEADDLVEVLRRLDGLPLGIELAARQVAVMSLGAVRQRLDRALDLATGRDEDPRQCTLRASIESSYRLLDEADRRLLRALAPFPGGVDLPTVEALVAAHGHDGDPVDLLHRLVDASLLAADPDSGRYRLLFTVRTFLADELADAGELEPAEEWFLDRCLAVAQEVGRLVTGPQEAAADRRLRAELDNLRAARDLAATRGRDDIRVGITVAMADAAIWRDLRELWAWALDLAADPRLAGHPDRVWVLACAADGARMLGDLDHALRLAEDSIALAGPGREPHRALSARASVAHFRGDFATARRDWLLGAEQSPAWEAGMIASAALAAAYDGDAHTARELLDRAHRSAADSGGRSAAAFAEYVEGELLATTDPAGAIRHYRAAIDAAGPAGGAFVEGVARVALASARTRTGDVATAAGDFCRLLDEWRRTGHQTQLWTTARNAAALLAGTGRRRSAALLLLAADAHPGAAAVNATIARHSGRAFVPLADVAEADELDGLRSEAAALGPQGVLDRAREELSALAATG